MGLVESIRGKFLPVGPDFLKYLLVVAVGLAAIDELGFQLVQLVLQFLSHRLAQGIALAACEAGQQATE